MRMYVRVLASTGAVLALGVCLLGVTRIGTAADDDEATKKAKAAAESVLKMADALEKADADAVKKEKATLDKMELLPIMTGFKKRDAEPVGGIGFGKPKQYDPDGIEAQIMGLAKKELPDGTLKKQADDIKKAAYISQAIAEASMSKCPVPKKMGDKDPKDWNKWMQDMKDASKALADAAKAGNAKDIKNAAGKLNASCNNCHGIFRDN
jgi:Cytochrome C'